MAWEKQLKTIEADVWMTQMLKLIYKKDSKEPTVNMFLALKQKMVIINKQIILAKKQKLKQTK